MERARRCAQGADVWYTIFMEHAIERRIYYHHTDAGGVVYYTSYLEQFEEGRAEFFLSHGFSLKELAETGVHFVVASVQVTFKAPAFFSDVVRITTRVEKVGSSSILFGQEVRRDGRLLVEAHTTVVCISDDFKPRRIPPDIRRILVATDGQKEAP